LFEKHQEGLDFCFKYEVLFVELLLHVPKILFELLLRYLVGVLKWRFVGDIIVVHHEQMQCIAMCPVVVISLLQILVRAI